MTPEKNALSDANRAVRFINDNDLVPTRAQADRLAIDLAREFAEVRREGEIECGEEGARIVFDDDLACPSVSPEEWRCSLVPGHLGRHAAICDDVDGDDGDKSALYVISTWGDA